MKKIIIIALAATVSLVAGAQNYQHSKYYNGRTDRLDYGNRYGSTSNTRWARNINTGDCYYGLRIGSAFSTVNSDDSQLDGGDSQTGLTVGAVVGLPLTYRVPLYFETGIYYTEKGGKKDISDGKKMTYDLNYIEVPLTLKYIYSPDGHFSVQPLFGGYIACGVGGKIKNFNNREAQNSFSDDNFKRFDGGLRLGCGIGYDVFYMDLTYDIGLSNICHDTFDTSHNGCLSLNFGVNF